MYRFAVVVVSMLLVACGDHQPRLVITGSSSVAPVIAELAERYEAQGGVPVDVQTGGSGRGLLDARQRLADFGMVSRALHDDEQDLQAWVLADDGLALIVHKENPVTTLTDEQVRAIFRGELRRWSELGGADRPITVVHKAEGRSTQELFVNHFGLRNSEVRPSTVIGDNQQGILSVLNDPHAIGYVSIGAALFEQQQGRPLRLLPLDGVPASLDKVASGDFPLSRPLVLVRGQPLDDTARDFLAFIRDPQQRDIYESYYFIPRH